MLGKDEDISIDIIIAFVLLLVDYGFFSVLIQTKSLFLHSEIQE